MTEQSSEDDGPQRNATRLASPTTRAGDYMSEAEHHHVGNRGVGNIRLIGLVGLGPASRVFQLE